MGEEGADAGGKGRPRVHLPLQATAFVGRAAEVAEIVQRLQRSECRLLSLVGPAGVGKTRLAIAVAQGLLAETGATLFRDGVYFVALQPVQDESGLIAGVADALGFRFYGSAPPRQQLLDFLREKGLLLILDNFEHLQDQAGWVAEMLGVAPGLKCLVTTRQALRLRQEWFTPVTGLRFSGGERPLAEGEPLDAWELFAQCARRANPAFDWMREGAQVQRICRLVDGMPLAIELAAAWVRVLPCQEIADELEAGLDILTARHQDLPQRHRSMGVLLEQAWQMLSGDEQEALKRMAVFRGEFSREAAETIAGASLPILAELVQRAVLNSGPRSRYRWHELLRQFAEGKLAAEPAAETAACSSHAGYFLHHVSDQSSHLYGPQQFAILTDMAWQIADIRAAWNWAVNNGRWSWLGEALHGLFGFFLILHRSQEGLDSLRYALSQLEAISQLEEECQRLIPRLYARIATLYHSLGELDQAAYHANRVLEMECAAFESCLANQILGHIVHVRGQESQALGYIEKAVGLAQELADPMAQCRALSILVNCHVSFGRLEAAAATARQALAIGRRSAAPNLTTDALLWIGSICTAQGKHEEAVGYLSEALALSQRFPGQNVAARAHQLLGFEFYSRGHPFLSVAQDHLENAIAIWQAMGNRGTITEGLGDLALTACELGDLDLALSCARRGLQIARATQHRAMVTYNHIALGAILCEQGETSQAEEHLTRSLQISVPRKVPVMIAAALYYRARLLVAESERAESQATRFEKLARALTILTAIRTDPRPWRFTTMRAETLADCLWQRLTANRRAELKERMARTSLEALAQEQLVRYSAARIPAPNTNSPLSTSPGSV